MDNSEKNFRSSYYTKVGFRKVDELKSIETFLSPKVDTDKIKLFLKNYSLPEVHRVRVWRILLGIPEPETEVQRYVRSLNCDRLVRAVQVLTSDTQASEDEDHRIAMMVILSDGHTRSSVLEQFASERAADLRKLAATLRQIFVQSFEDRYYMTSALSQLMSNNFKNFTQIKAETEMMLMKEHRDLYDQVKKFSFDQTVEKLVSTCFMEALDIPLIIKVWDKVIGGYYRQIMPKLTVAYLAAIKDNLMQATNQDEYVSCFRQLVASDKNELIIDYIN